MPNNRLKRRIGLHLWVLLAVLAFGGLLLLAYAVWAGYRDAQLAAVDAARSKVLWLESRFDASLRGVDASLADLAARDDLLGLLGSEGGGGASAHQSVEQEMRRRLDRFPELLGLRIADASGNVRWQAGENHYLDLADPAFLARLRDAATAGLLFSEVHVGQESGSHVLVVARVLRDARNELVGVAAAGIDLGYFERLIESVRPRSDAFFAIVRADNFNWVLAQPPGLALLNQPMPGQPALFAAIRGGAREGIVEEVSDLIGKTQTLGFRQLENYPFMVLAGVASEDALAVWRQRAFRVSGLGTVLFAGLVWLIIWMMRAERRELRAIDDLQRGRLQLREAQRLAQIGSWELDIVANRLVWSEELFRIFEIDPAQGPHDYQQFLACVHPDDRQRVDEAYRRALKNRENYEVEHRMLMPDGRIKLIRERGETHYDESGIPLRSIGTTQDITDLRRMEAQMELLGSAFQHSGEAIVITDHANNIVTVNPAFTKLTGYTLEEVRGRNPRMLSAGRTSDVEYERMWKAIREHGFWQGEIWDRRKDGAVYPKWLSISVMRNDDGGIRHYIAHFTDVSAERAAEAKLHHMAHHDMLTGLYNRFSLKDSLDHALAVARRQSGRIALMFIDLDRFKVINDTLGHHVGDELLIQVAKRLRAGVRESDVVARLGGDEFVVMLTGIEHSSAVAMVAEKLVGSLGEAYAVAGHSLYSTPSIGIALFPLDGNDADTLMKNADAAMYHAKTAGRNNFQFFDARMNDAALERLNIEHSLRQALGRDEFRLHFQPLIDVRSGRVEGVEALVRWQHPERGLLPPGLFIGVAEETGLIQPLGEWVFWAACRQLADFRSAGLHDIRMGINISAVQMRNGNLPVLAKGAIEAFGLKPGDLVFEITETVAMEQPDETVRVLDELHAMGVTLALDDFGTGYSSLSYLRMFALDHLKLDRSFVEEIGRDIDGQAICDATIGLAHNLGLRLIAEGVETEEQLAYLKEKGCDLVQGYLFSRPVPADEVIAFIQQRNS